MLPSSKQPGNARGSSGHQICWQRTRLHLTQEALADAIGVSPRSISRWEHDQSLPQPVYRERLARLFGIDATWGLGGVAAEESSLPPAQPPIWSVPSPRNLYFTGRQQVLQCLEDCFLRPQALPVLALTGLGGVGKTQTATEYAYRHQDDYQAVLWVRAETHATLLSDVVALAGLLGIPDCAEQDLHQTVEAVKRWLSTHTDWLLILDNLDDVQVLTEVYPATGKGHLLLTSRTMALGTLAHAIEVGRMTAEEGTCFLLRRAKLITPDRQPDEVPVDLWRAAGVLVELMDGLPLALDQAGAYMEETGCGVESYLLRYQSHQRELLKRRGQYASDHPASVTTTFALAFAKIEHAHLAAAELLCLCAFLHPEAIPEALLVAGASALGPILGPVAADPYQLDAALAVLRASSLLQRHPETQTLSLHRLVQAVLKDHLDRTTAHTWAARTVHALAQAFPSVSEATWSACERYLPHALACADLIQAERVVEPAALHLLLRTVQYLLERGYTAQAEPLAQQALALSHQIYSRGTAHPVVAALLTQLGQMHTAQGHYAEAEPLYQQALAIYTQMEAASQTETALALRFLGDLYRIQGRSQDAEARYQAAMVCYADQGDPEPSALADTLNSLALLLCDGERYAEAERLYHRALAIYAAHGNSAQAASAITLNNLALLYRRQARYAEAERLYQQALPLHEAQFGPNHPRVAALLHNLAKFYHLQQRYAEAEPLYRRAVGIEEAWLGPDHPETALTLRSLARLYGEQRRYAEAEPLYQRVLAVQEQSLGLDHASTKTTQAEYAQLRAWRHL